MMGDREAFLQDLLVLAPDMATGHKRDVGTIWNEGNLRDALGIPTVPPAPILFTIDVPYPVSCDKQSTMRFQVTAEALARAAASEVERGLEMGIARQCQTLIDENIALRQRIFELEGGFSTRFPAAYEVAQEVTEARKKYPEGDLESRIDGFVQESGEAMQALLKLKYTPGDDENYSAVIEHARLEVRQAAGQAIRLLEETLGTSERVTRICASINEHEPTN